MNQLGLNNFTSEYSALHNIIIQQCMLDVSPGVEILDNRTNDTNANECRRPVALKNSVSDLKNACEHTHTLLNKIK